MKHVVLLGDSLRLHRQPIVAEQLGAGVSVYGPPENCRDSRTLLRHLDEWAPCRTADVVHVNCGLHDIRHDPGGAGPVVDLAEYRENLERVLSLLWARVTKHVIFATSTPINEDRHNANRPGRRYAVDVAAYNAVALGLTAQLGIAVNDLYGAVVSEGADGLLKCDGVHFNEHGYRFLGLHVARAISSVLA
jgi:lysophospholipase L1-like esterase